MWRMKMRRDLERYILDLANRSIQMRAEVEKINKQAEKFNYPKEVLENLQQQVNIVESNYQRVLYCKYLLDLKPKWIRDLIDKKAKKKAKEFMEKKADKESVKKENEEALEKVKEISNG